MYIVRSEEDTLNIYCSSVASAMGVAMRRYRLMGRPQIVINASKGLKALYNGEWKFSGYV